MSALAQRPFSLPLPPPRLWTALAVSVGLHVVFVAGLRPARIELPQPFAVERATEQLEVSFVAPSPLRPAGRVAETPAARPTPPAKPVAVPAPAENTGGAERDEPLVEARFDVAALRNPKPPYPLAARRQGIEGRVLLAAHVRADGTCSEVRLKRSSGHGLLDRSALDTVRRWRFLPARRGGVALDSWVEIPISFRLEGGRPDDF